MRSIWKIIYNFILVLVFIILSVFSLIEYQGEPTADNISEDKLPLAKTTITKISYLISFLEKMPAIRLLPAVTSGADYEKQMLSIIDKEQLNSIKEKTNIKEKIDIMEVNFKANPEADLVENTNLSGLWQRLKERLTKDWSRP